MQLIKEIVDLVYKEALMEWRQKHAINAVLLYLVCTVFICYISFGINNRHLSIPTWNALFWIIILFSGLNAVAKSFLQERTGRFFYYYQICSPQSIIFSKIIYNSLMMVVLAFTGLGIYSLFLGNPVENTVLFIVTIFLSSIGFASILTMISGIASKSGNNNTLMAVLSFPVLIPILLLTIRVSKNAIDGLDFSVSTERLLIIAALDVISISVSYLLFPYIWRT